MLFEQDLLFQTLLFIILTVVLFVISRKSIQILFVLFHKLFRNDHIVFICISAFFLPGTIIHELSHFVMAILLFLPVHEIQIFPKKQGSYIKLGYVIYEKKDVIRSILVGIAPIIVGMLAFWWLYTISFFTSDIWYIQLFKIYIMFVLSTTMFSSKQDLIDIGYIIPLLLLCAAVIYVLDINILFFLQIESIVSRLTHFMYSVTTYLSISIGIHSIIVLVYYLWNKRLHKG